ncbi:MAG TPA: trypsin-like peptidase domain-containing protein [Solirubrobacteraceae bacterium]|nr:trypsin-like peptidase domain-containing protein [Solirubrobacteraceae bacterium]
MSARPLVAALATTALVAACGSSGPSHPATAGASASAGSGASGFDASTVYHRDAPGVVTVISVFTGSGSGRGETLQGSGFVIASSGEVVTNAHVVTTTTGAATRRANHVYVQFSDGNEVPARIVGADPNADVALLAIDPSGLSLRPLALGSSASLSVGAPVAALGSPFGEAGSMSVGVISATNRLIQSLNGTNPQNAFSIPGAIQTDAAINHGNSGGPLVNSSGAVIGISSQIASSTGGGQGVGFAVPVDTVKRSVAQLRARGSVAYAYIGVRSVDLFPQLGRRLNLGATHGAYVQSVAPGGPAARAGLRGGSTKLSFDAAQYVTGGDVITKLDGRPLTLGYDITDAIAPMAPGQTVTLEVWRGGAARQVKVTLGTRPAGGEG